MNDKLLLLSNAVLVVFTGIYVFLTYKLIKTTIKNNNVNNRISALPLLECRIIKQNKKIRLQIQNISNNPAFDLDIWFFGILFDTSVGKKELLNKYILKDKNQLKEADEVLFVDDEQYAVFERSIFATLPMNKCIDYEIDYPIKFEQFDIFIQYRDHIGNNYGQLFWFFENNNEFRLGNINPNVICPINRIDLTDDKIDLRKVSEGFHFMIHRYFVSIDGRRLLKNDDSIVENRWKII